MQGLKINLEAIADAEQTEQDELCADGLRLGSLLVSSHGLTSSMGPSYVLSPQDLTLLPEADGGFLGKGSSGSVRRALNRRTGNIVALKEIKVTSQAHLGEIRRELETLHASGAESSSYLADFYGAFSHEGSVFIAMECLDGSLDELAKPVPDDVLAHITRSVLQGLVYLHRRRHLIHRDLKPSNVLYRHHTGCIKISDFGLSSNLECTKGDAHSFVGTVTYMSPERLKGEVYSYAADVWSLGLVVAELALGHRPFSGLRGGSTEARFWALLQHLSSDGPALELPPSMHADLADFITQCVRKAPETRPTCAELLMHPFIISNCGSEPNMTDDCAAIHSWIVAEEEKARESRRRRAEERGDRQRAVCSASGRQAAQGVSLSAFFPALNGKEGACGECGADSNFMSPGPRGTSGEGRSSLAAAEEETSGTSGLQRQSNEPSVNLDDELNKLLF